MKVTRKIIEIDDELCDGCGECVPSCAEGALVIVDGKARMIAEKYCDGLGACLGECPNGALKIIEREADDFDEEAVEELLATKAKESPKPMEVISGGCPSSQLKTFVPGKGGTPAESESALSHWPVQIMLVPSNAPFLNNADLLVVADCGPLSYPNFHRDFLKDKAVMMGCPKFDNVDTYINKFAKVFTNSNIKSITAVIMEVPCCSALPSVVKKGLELAGKKIPFEEVVISTRGQIVEKRIIT
jgi:NAD-dependent dihydropyrimidine dehydrogenase PreA subunit